MNSVASLGLILLVSLLAGHLVKVIRVPEVTGYILAGLVLGPSGLGWIGKDNIAGLGIFSEVALGLILFSIGSIFQFDRFRKIRKTVVKLTLLDAGLVFVLMTGTMLFLHQGLQVSLILGVVAIETAAASTLMVMREYNTSGPLTENLIGMIAINNVVCLTAFSILTSSMRVFEVWQHTSGSVQQAIYRPAFLLVWQLIGSVALGYLIGIILSSWATKVVEHGETLILLIGCLLLCVGLSDYLELSTLVASLAIGATAANFSRHSRRLAEVQSGTDPPFYAIFFVIAGANLHVGLLKSLGLVGVGYVVARAVGKLLGAKLGGSMTKFPEPARNGLTYATLPHAGLAIGLVLSLGNQLPNLTSTVSTIVLAAILVYELVGPVCTKLALKRSGEVHARTAEAPELG